MRPWVQRRVQRRGLLPAAVAAVVGTVVLYLLATVGVGAWRGQDVGADPARSYLPQVVENAPATVGTTREYGPPGPVALTFAGTEVADGLVGSLDRAWLTVSGTSGDYRALVAPGLPAPAAGVMSTSPDGSTLAWVGPEGLVVYDTGSGRTERLEVAGLDRVGPFSPDSGLVAVHAGGVRIVDVTTGEVVAESDAEARALTGSAWRPDGTALDLVAGDELLTLGVDGSTERRPTSIPATAQLAWAPSGDRLADLRDVDGNNRLFLSPLREDGTVAEGRQVEVPGVSVQRLLGFSGDGTLAVSAYLLESGPVERVLDVSLDTGTTTDLTVLPSPGRNWVGTQTMSVATDTLARGSFDWPSPLWPWSYTSRLAASALVMFFLLGLYVTRRPRGR